MIRTPSIYSQDDPLAQALKPSISETDSERRFRLTQETEARRISEEIDEELRQEREKLKKSKGTVKLLLLGQAESGKSTLQKQFQLMYKPNSLEQERASWRAVIFFNIVHSIKHILNTLEAWDDLPDESEIPFRAEDSDDATSTNLSDYDHRRATSFANQPSPSASLLDISSAASGSMPLSDSSTSYTPSSDISKDSQAYQIANLRRRLSPLVASDSQLADRLSGGISVSGSGKGNVFVRSGWQARAIENVKGKGRRNSSIDLKGQDGPFRETADGLVQDVGKMLEACKDDIEALWTHPTVKSLIAKRKLKLEEWSVYFLNDIARVTKGDFIPTYDDILHARIQTMGVAEHVFDVDLHGKNVTWRLFDVGGARGQRHSWVPYFDDANAIIFVAPVSAFDQYLEEDPRTNRIDDSLQIFTQICSNPLLKNAHLVLFLNKTDLLREKLAAGLSVQKYITSFGQRSNDYDSVVQYFRAHFQQVHRKNNENKRVLYTHFTSVVDTKTTQRIIANVRDSIFRGYLQQAALV